MKPKMTSERGQALILIALAMVGMVAIVGLAIDGSRKFADQRHAQNAADTAAIAAALAKVDALKNGVSDKSPTTNAPTTCPPPSGILPSPVCSLLLTDGKNRAQNNGYTHNLTTSTVEIFSPPISGHYIGDYDYVQVIITSFINTTFMKVIGITQTQNIVQAVALAKPEYTLAQGAMIISYDPDPNCSVGGTGGYSVQVTGSATVNLTGGGIFLNSDETCGFKIPNCADLNIYSGSINSVGNNIDTGSCTFDPPVTKKINQDPVKIPDEVYWPPVPKECSGAYNQAPVKLGEITVPGNPQPVQEWLIKPGYYETFPQAALVANKSHIYMASGVYCIDVEGPTKNAELKWSTVDAAELHGSTDPATNKYSIYNPNGVTLYIRNGDRFTINATSPTYLDATSNPSSDYQGYLIILEGSPTVHPSCTVNGGATIDINGMIFAPYCDITLNGKAGETAAFNAQLIGWDILINGTNAINFNYDPANQVKIKRKVGLMK